MMQSPAPRPTGVALTPFAGRVFDVLARYTAFPWPLLKTRCKAHGIDAARIIPTQLSKVAADLGTAVARFTSPEQGRAAEHELRNLIS